MTRIFIVRLLIAALFCISAFPAVTSSAQTPPETSVEPAQPPWQVCNETSFILNVATAMVPAGQKNLAVTGWLNLRPGACQTMMVERETPRFVYARSAPVHRGGIREWQGAHEYCLGPNDFVAEPDMDCALQGFGTALYLRVIPTEERTAFVEPANFRSNAQTAGLQRLLMDNNYDIKRIDGQAGRRTSKTLAKFLKDNKLKTSISLEDQYGALVSAALALQNAVGVEVCNTAQARIWSALALQTEQGWESRGWWPVDPNQCIRPYTQSLVDSDVYFYARIETAALSDKVLSVDDKNGRDFCIGEARFAAVQHEFCEDSGYVSARFRALPKEKTGIKIDLGASQFSGAVIGGLRQ